MKTRDETRTFLFEMIDRVGSQSPPFRDLLTQLVQILDETDDQRKVAEENLRKVEGRARKAILASLQSHRSMIAFLGVVDEEISEAVSSGDRNFAELLRASSAATRAGLVAMADTLEEMMKDLPPLPDESS